MGKRVVARAAVCAFLVASSLVTISGAAAAVGPTSGPVTCDPNAPTCTVAVGDPGSPGSSPAPQGGGTGTPGCTPPSGPGIPAGVDCNGCLWQQVTAMPAGLNPVNSTLIYAVFYQWQTSKPPGTLDEETCYPSGAVNLIYTAPGQPLPNVAPTPGQLAQQALASLTLPNPTTGRGLASTLADGRPYSLVRASTWFWTDPGSYKTYSASASVAGVAATVTVTPGELTFTPGDGSAAVSCTGPGTAWTHSDSPWVTSPTRCDYSYPHSSYGDPGGELTATYGITWRVTWTGTGGVGGVLPDITTTSTSTFAIAEAEAVVVQ